MSDLKVSTCAGLWRRVMVCELEGVLLECDDVFCSISVIYDSIYIYIVLSWQWQHKHDIFYVLRTPIRSQ